MACGRSCHPDVVESITCCSLLQQLMRCAAVAAATDATRAAGLVVLWPPVCMCACALQFHARLGVRWVVSTSAFAVLSCSGVCPAAAFELRPPKRLAVGFSLGGFCTHPLYVLHLAV